MSADSAHLLRRLVAGYTSYAEERLILELVAAASQAELNAMLGDDRFVDGLLASLKDRRDGSQHRQELLELLIGRRLPELTLANRGRLVHALQTGRTGLGAENWVAQILLAHRGLQLTDLKNELNSSSSFHDLERLIFADIDDEGVRRQILNHLAAEAGAVGILGCKVLSDIDDTALCTLKDTRFPKGILYPGVVAFWEALDCGPTDTPVSIGNLTFVTARPGDALGLVENRTRATLRKAGIADNSVLTGGFASITSHDAMAAKKLQNVSHYRQLFGEYRLVFIGDSGQGDVTAGLAMYQSFPEALAAVFIHDVVSTPLEQRSAYANQGIWFFDSYVGAAHRAHHLGLISDDGLSRVITETRAGFDAIIWDTQAQEQRMRALLDRDVADSGSGIGSVPAR